MTPVAWSIVIGAAAQAALLAGAWLHGHHAGRAGPLAQLHELEARAADQQTRYVQLQKDAQNAQAQIIGHYRSQSADDRRGWNSVRVRLEAARSASRLPSICSESGSADSAAQDSVARTGRADLRAQLIDALEAGEIAQSTLDLCQRELTLCASLR